MSTPTLVVGRGLLGRQLVASLAREGDDVRTVDVPWFSGAEALAALTQAARSTAEGSRGWRLAWCAGAGVIATSAEALQREASTFARFLGSLRFAPDALILASSVGGVYGGSADGPPYCEYARTGAVSAYGLTKLAMENSAKEIATLRGSRVVLARIANLYGPGQNLSKPQGLISQLCLSQVTGRPLGVYASFDTLRDYVFAPDAARMMKACLDRICADPPSTVVVKILASGRAVSIGALIGEVTRSSRRRPRIFTRAPLSQASDLRVRSKVWTDIDSLASTPLMVGLRATTEDIGLQSRTGLLQGHMAPGI